MLVPVFLFSSDIFLTVFTGCFFFDCFLFGIVSFFIQFRFLTIQFQRKITSDCFTKNITCDNFYSSYGSLKIDKFVSFGYICAIYCVFL